MSCKEGLGWDGYRPHPLQTAPSRPGKVMIVVVIESVPDILHPRGNLFGKLVNTIFCPSDRLETWGYDELFLNTQVCYGRSHLLPQVLQDRLEP